MCVCLKCQVSLKKHKQAKTALRSQNKTKMFKNVQVIPLSQQTNQKYSSDCLYSVFEQGQRVTPSPSGSSRSGVTVAVMSGQTAYAEITRAPDEKQTLSTTWTTQTYAHTLTHTHTWSLDGLRPHSCCHTQRVLAPIDGYSKLTHDLTHGFAGLPQTRPFPRQFGSPHPVPTTFNVLKHANERKNYLLVHLLV